MAHRFLSYVKQSVSDITTEVSQIHIVFDVYRESSIKSQTRDKHTTVAGKPSGTFEVRPGTKVPEHCSWKGFLTVGENKTALAAYYIQYMKEQNRNLATASLFVSGSVDEDGIMITRSAELPALDILSNQKEADTRLVLHACAAAKSGLKVIVVCSPDTDVLILLLHHWPTIKSELYYLTGKGGKTYHTHKIHSSPHSIQVSHQASIQCASSFVLYDRL